MKSVFDVDVVRFLQHARELETRRREAEERERKKQREVQMELERQLKEAETVREGPLSIIHPIDFHLRKNSAKTLAL